MKKIIEQKREPIYLEYFLQELILRTHIEQEVIQDILQHLFYLFRLKLQHGYTIDLPGICILRLTTHRKKIILKLRTDKTLLDIKTDIPVIQDKRKKRHKDKYYIPKLKPGIRRRSKFNPFDINRNKN